MKQHEDSEPNLERVDRLDDRILQLILDFYKSENERITRQQFQDEVLLALHFAVAGTHHEYRLPSLPWKSGRIHQDRTSPPDRQHSRRRRATRRG
jgi:hypothetical protein